ncbi:origin recognition complex subunit 3 N-terminus-domain-containing protein [Apodospora peruviana]|uniref:Origin recognition complex subunit 3 N-terminus-domain-containing protein n=1 Tax=Apodospora peruviana TaxID=516989 RepID=A0AAE0MG20_9PEZI|nr:origin recognition complex subunit 3 N-terminus-domain-containing protein [Apodospora peruviana]
MAEVEEDPNAFAFQEDDHRGAYIFTASHPAENQAASAPQPSKRRRVSGKKRKSNMPDATPVGEELSDSDNGSGLFVSLFSGSESKEAIELRRRTFEKGWGDLLEGRIQRVLREANQNTLDEVGSFMWDAEAKLTADGEGASISKKIPAGFIITGPNIASQDLLFEQLAETLSDAKRAARVVRLRSAGAPNLKAALKKIINDATASLSERSEDDDIAEVSVGEDGRKHLNYDLEGLYAFLKARESRRVIIAFEDSEAFDSGLLTDLIVLFHSWQGRIQFSLLFGIATSVDLFQARLLKSTAQVLYGAQFDVVQADSVLESVFRSAVAGSQALLRLGPSLLQNLLERQKDQVAGIHVFISSLKYAYMCHFYANPLSVLLADDGLLDRKLLQPEHIEAIRSLGSFREHVEASVEARQLNHAQSLLDDDEYLISQILQQRQKRLDYLTELLRSLHLLTTTGLRPGSFTDLYVSALVNGVDLLSEDFSNVFDSARKLGPGEIISLITSLLNAIQAGSPDLDLQGWESDADELVTALSGIQDKVETLVTRAKQSGQPLKSKYSAQGKILRTTVVAQKVQLSHDSATLTDEDKAFTKAIDDLTELLSTNIYCPPANSLFLHEAWLYNSKSPYRDVFVPRPGTTFERALSRPHDYLNCSCCAKVDGTLAATMPTASILYHMYLETGSLVNVSDLWSAYYALVGDESDMGLDERSALFRFYRALAELRLMGFVKQSKKKADHVAKLKWL